MQAVFHSIKAFDWTDSTRHMIRIYRADDPCSDDVYYTIKVDGELWRRVERCEGLEQVEKEINDILALYDWKLIPAEKG